MNYSVLSQLFETFYTSFNLYLHTIFSKKHTNIWTKLILVIFIPLTIVIFIARIQNTKRNTKAKK